MKLELIDWSKIFPDLTSTQLAKLESTYCSGCSKNVGLEKIGFMQCLNCSIK